MIVETPDPAIFSAAVLAGAPGLAVVMKAAYDLVPDGAGARRMVPSADAARRAILMADQGVLLFSATDLAPPVDQAEVPAGALRLDPRPGETPPAVQVLDVAGQTFETEDIATDPDKRLEFRVAREADTALEKARADIVVLGFIGASRRGAVTVDETLWLGRDLPPADADGDSARNLFGFEPRGSDARRALAGDLAAFAPFHRRGGGMFDDSGTGTALPAGGRVEIFQDNATTGTPYALRLPDLVPRVRLRVWCGHGPDWPPRWRKVPLGAMRADTLIVDPAAHRAEILWRLRWAAGTEPPDRYRSVQIREEE
ncbi:hypothetical protein LV780_21320 (plasmid) [Cereibacter azotoformans]|uniref:Uncharacterized protein n=1 Tax=Cereibacter azotoformans TaxID=43057 RepID=A0A2T5JV09_9RHOB|nr:hypothetical protein [Cereibacter azotoformans]AXQ96274.1 hypothetical protein D0Z66_21485 [Cereibacter sphaeroides]PTR13888.1 hypothetical protein C8J28_11953 [Cereibacter azotoformans]UIJ33168.1 hypothetical protein LV780_21320 [Cereibacter azotoformans]